VGSSLVGDQPVSLARRDLGIGELSADAEGFRVTLRWVPPTGAVRGFRVYREDELVADLSDGGATTFVDDGVLPASDYAYEVESTWGPGLASRRVRIEVTTGRAST
jgi:hypothetical protein